eukprot:849510-Rhodomonas_salina.3
MLPYASGSPSCATIAQARQCRMPFFASDHDDDRRRVTATQHVWGPGPGPAVTVTGRAGRCRSCHGTDCQCQSYSNGSNRDSFESESLPRTRNPSPARSPSLTVTVNGRLPHWQAPSPGGPGGASLRLGSPPGSGIMIVTRSSSRSVTTWTATIMMPSAAHLLPSR